MLKNKEHFIRVSGKRVPVSEKIYRTYYKMYRRERYLVERDERYGKVLYNDLSTEEMSGEEMIPDKDAERVEDIVINKIMSEKLRECLKLLSEAEQKIIDALINKEYSEREWSAISGIPRKTIAFRREKLYSKLRELLEK